jgi:hypothetical protein
MFPTLLWNYQIDDVTALTNLMFSDSSDVLDVLAETIELLALDASGKPMSVGQMEHARYIMGVDSDTFRAMYSAYQLRKIDSKLMVCMVQQLASAIGLQRFRYEAS